MTKKKNGYLSLSDAEGMFKATFGQSKDRGRNALTKSKPSEPDTNQFADIERELLAKGSEAPDNLNGSHIPAQSRHHAPTNKVQRTEPRQDGRAAKADRDLFQKERTLSENQGKRGRVKGAKQGSGGKKKPDATGVSKSVITKLPGMKAEYERILQEERMKAAEANSRASKPVFEASEERDRKEVFEQIRLLVGSSTPRIDLRATAVSPASAEAIEKAIKVGASAFAAAPDPDLDNGFIVGFDFGTSSLKLAVRQPYRAGDNIAFLPVPRELRSGDHSHLWQTAVWFDPASRAFSLFPQAGMEVLEGFKTGIIGGYGGERVRSDLPVTRTEAAIAYIAMQIAHFLGWYSIAKPLAAGGDRYLSINIGIPVAAHDDEVAFTTFRRIVCAAQSLVGCADKLNLLIVREAHQKSSPHCPAGWELVPELTAAIAGYAADPTSQSGAHVLIDVGASTLDIVAFNHLRQERIAVIGAGVELLGSSALETAISGGVTVEDCGWACDQQFRFVFFDACRHSRGGNGFSPKLRSRDVQLIITGGGCASSVHSAFIESRICPDMLGTFPIVRPEPPLSGISGASDASRLLLAYGLTRDVPELLELKLPSQVPSITRPNAPSVAFIDKDMV